jgi:hypothetical protein
MSAPRPRRAANKTLSLALGFCRLGDFRRSRNDMAELQPALEKRAAGGGMGAAVMRNAAQRGQAAAQHPPHRNINSV